MTRAFGLLVLLLAGCSGESTLILQVRTDLSSGIGFDAMTVELSGEGVTRDARREADEATGWGEGVRVAELEGLAPGSYQLTVSALSADTVVVSRPVRVELDGGIRVLTVLLTRDCEGVACPGAGDPSSLACLGGRCVPEGCTEETPELCPMPECTSDAQCIGASSCVVAECSPSGTCFEAPDSSRCAAGETCDVVRGCVVPSTCVEWEVALAGADLGTGAAPGLSLTTTSILVIWDTGPGGVYVSARDAADGSALEPSNELSMSARDPRITPTSSGALVSWVDAGLEVLRIDRRGGRVDGPITVAPRAIDHSAIWTGGGALVAWTAPDPSLQSVYVDFVAGRGVTTLVSAQASALSHALMGSEAWLIFQDTGSNAIRISPTDPTDGSFPGGDLAIPGIRPVFPSTAQWAGNIGIAWLEASSASSIRFLSMPAGGPLPSMYRELVARPTGGPAPQLATDQETWAIAYRTASDTLAFVSFDADPMLGPAPGRELSGATLTSEPRLIGHPDGFYAAYRGIDAAGTQDVFLRKICP